MFSNSNMSIAFEKEPVCVVVEGVKLYIKILCINIQHIDCYCIDTAWFSVQDNLLGEGALGFEYPQGK